MAYILMILGWGLVGWCGTRGPRPPIPEPKPGPKHILIGIIAGIVGGFAYMFAFSLKVPLSPLEYAATCIGAFVAGFVVYDIAELFTGR